MNLVQLDIETLEQSGSNKNTYILLLKEIGGKRKLPIVIGPCNAGSIAIYLESNHSPERPLTHDIIKEITNNFDITVSRVVIHTLKEGVFHASFFCFMDGDKEIEIDARTSDAIAIAVRMGCPIFTYEDILVEAGVIITRDMSLYKDEETEELEDKKDVLETLSLGQLKKEMENAIKNEDYEEASKIRDEINKRKENK